MGLISVQKAEIVEKNRQMSRRRSEGMKHCTVRWNGSIKKNQTDKKESKTNDRKKDAEDEEAQKSERVTK